MRIRWLRPDVGHLHTPANLGVIRSGDRAILVDAGPDEATAQAILAALRAEGLRPVGVVLTHHHADHAGGAAALAAAGLVLAVPRGEVPMVEDPSLEPRSFFGGAAPPPWLDVPSLHGAPAGVDLPLAPAGGLVDVAGVAVEVVPLPGHTAHHAGVRSGDVLFAGDALLGEAVLRRYGVAFCTDHDAHRATLEALAASPPPVAVPAHGRPVEDVADLARAHLAALDRLEESVLASAAGQGAGTDGIMAHVCRSLRVPMPGPAEWHLVQTAVLACLASLDRRGLVTAAVADGALRWSRP